MLKNFILESYRNKINRPLSFIVNWFSMTLGFAAVIVMYLYIIGELNHDNNCFEGSMDAVYRCEMGDTDMGSICPSALQPFVSEMAEVQSASRVLVYPAVVATQGLSTEKRLKLVNLFVDSTFMDIMPFRVIAGNASKALEANDNVIISRSAAMKLYDTNDVVGKIVLIDNKYPATIMAVIEDVPENSSFNPEIIATNGMLCKMWDMSPESLKVWGHWNSDIYIKLRNNVDIQNFEPKFVEAVKSAVSKEWNTEYTNKIELRPFLDCYLAQIEGYTLGKTTNPNDLWVLGFVALLILMIAIINYVNIYTARSTEVIRAMGIKSIMGAVRAELIGYVIFDSVVITLISVISGFVLALVLRPLYGLIIGSEVIFALDLYSILVLFVGLPLLCGVISGIFPALALTRIKPLDVMVNRSSGGGRHMIWVRNILIVFQFTITIVLIASTLFINKQMKYMGEMELGYDRDNVYVVNGSMFMGPKFETFRSTLLQNPNIVEVAFMKNNPMFVGEFTTVGWGDKEDDSKTINIMRVDENALRLLGVEMVEGDSLSVRNIKNLRYRQMIINETFAKDLRAKIPDLTFPYKDFMGVFKDFQSTPMYEGLAPLGIGSIWTQGDTPMGTAYIKIAEGSDLSGMLKFIEQSFSNIYPNELYESIFMDEQFNEMYSKEQFFRTRLMTFSILAIFIGCLGLFALVGYSVERRRCEIAIRKVYGSSVTQIMVMLGLGFGRLLIVSFIIAVPIVLYVMSSWVEQFAYRSPISWWIFAVALICALVVAGCTIFYMTYHAANENPAESVET